MQHLKRVSNSIVEGTLLFCFSACPHILVIFHLLFLTASDRAAEARLNEGVRNNYGELVKALAAEIAVDGKPLQSRQMASIFLKNALYAKSSALQTECHDRWKVLDSATRQTVKDSLIVAMRSSEHGVRYFTAVAVAEIACVQLPFNQWPSF